MGRLESKIQFTGSFGGLSFYRMKGVDFVVVRRRKGPSKEKIRRSPQFDAHRRNSKEFMGRSRAASALLDTLHPLKTLADHNLIGPLTALMTRVQDADRGGEFGQRDIRLSQHPYFIDNYSLNRNTHFEKVVRAPIAYDINRPSRTATVDIPALKPGHDFIPVSKHTHYRFVATLGVVADLFYEDRYMPTYTDDRSVVHSPWYRTDKGNGAITLETALHTELRDDVLTLVLGIGIEYGREKTPRNIIAEKDTGCAKILKGA